MKKVKIFFDTNVLVYAHDEKSPFHEESADLLSCVFTGSVTGVVSEQNLLELYRVLTHPAAMSHLPFEPEQAASLIRRVYLEDAFEVVYTNRSVLQRCLELIVQHHVVTAKVFDMRLAAQVLESRVDYLATYNIGDFKGIQGIDSKTPKEILALF
ncbi:MAG: PIN domain-containing protein [Candidatus Omnitrophota bacterium]